jgi:uncharacterized repeat protein (TIGR03803 family)
MGGKNNKGTIYWVDPRTGFLRTSYSFRGTPDGEAPAALRQAGSTFYGTANFGGAPNGGTVFAYTP